LSAAIPRPARLHNGQNSDLDAIVQDVNYYDRICANQYIIANSNWAKQLSPHPDINVMADNRGAIFLDMTYSHDYPVADTTVITKLRVAVNYDPAKMISNEVVS
jgi:hypothetical protein